MMNRVLNVFLFVTIMASMVVSFSSCNKDDGEYRNYYTSRGTIQGTQLDFDIITDEGAILNVVKNSAGSFQIEDGKRVLVSYVVDSHKDANYDVQVIGMAKLLTKDPVYLSKLTQIEQDGIGKDPISVLGAWFGGKKYLNIDFEVRRTNPNLAHFINLVVDEENSTEDEVIVTLRHNAYGDYPAYQAIGLVSFDITGLVPEGKREVKVTLKWTDYSGFNKSDSGVFKLDEAPAPTAKSNRKYTGSGVLVN